MKKTIAVFLALTVIFAMTAISSAAGIFSIKTSLSPWTPVQSLTISAEGGESMDINAGDMEMRLGIEQGALKGLTFTSVPNASDGVFIVDGVEVEVFDYLSRSEVDKLCFIASANVAAMTASFMPDIDGAVETSLNIQVLSAPNLKPTAIGIRRDTLKNVSVSGFISVYDPEGDSIGMQIIKRPTKGDVSFDGQQFAYEPFTNLTGADYFTVRAYDNHGNYSDEATIEINIEDVKSRNAFYYADMRTNPSNYAALKLREANIMTGRQIGDEWFFNPAIYVSRGDFLVMLLAASETEIKPSVNTGLPNDSDIPYWLKPYVKKAVDEKIISGNQAFNYNETPTRAEAVQMTDKTAKINDVKLYTITVGDTAEIPDWAMQSYIDLAAYKMLDLHDGHAHPGKALDNAYSADLVWQLYKYCRANK